MVEEQAQRIITFADHIPPYASDISPPIKVEKLAASQPHMLWTAVQSMSEQLGLPSFAGPAHEKHGLPLRYLCWLAGATALGTTAVHLPDLWSYYCYELDAHPLTTKSVIGVIGTIMGDAIAQVTSHFAFKQHHHEASTSSPAAPPQRAAEFKYDFAHLGRLLLYTIFVGNPTSLAWFHWLDQFLMPDDPTSMVAVASKVLVDQAVAAPPLTVLFFLVMKALEGKPEEAWPTAAAQSWPTLKLHYIVWPLAHVVNFALVPPSQRILYVNAVSVLWTAYMSYTVCAGPADAASSCSQAGPADSKVPVLPQAVPLPVHVADTSNVAAMQ
jgi:protein Mpv17